MEKSKKQLDSLAFRNDGGLLVAASHLTNRYWTGKLIYVGRCDSDSDLDVEQCKLVADIESGVTDVTWVADTQRLILACDSGSVEIWELSDESDSLGCVGRLIEHDNIVSTVSTNVNSSKFVSSDHSGCLKVWDVGEFTPVSTYQAHSDAIWSTAFHPTFPDTLASCSQDGQVYIWDLRQLKPARKIEREFIPSSPSSVAWQPGADHSLAIGTETGLVGLQDCRVGVGIPSVIQVHTRFVRRLSFSPLHSDWLASASNDSTSAVVKFSRTGSSILSRFSNHQDFVQDVAWNPLNNRLYTCSWDGTILSHEVNQPSDIINSAPTS